METIKDISAVLGLLALWVFDIAFQLAAPAAVIAGLLLLLGVVGGVR